MALLVPYTNEGAVSYNMIYRASHYLHYEVLRVFHHYNACLPAASKLLYSTTVVEFIIVLYYSGISDD